VKYRAATTTAPINKFEKAKPVGTNTSNYQCASQRGTGERRIGD
jgi:hypothetical protein